MNAFKLLLTIIFISIAAMAITSCGGSEDNDTPISMSMPLLNEPSGHGEGIGWGRSDCTTCHPLASLPTPHPPTTTVTDTTEDETCMMCHLGNGADNRFTIPQCVKCHTDTKVFGSNTMKVTGFSAHTVSNTANTTLVDRDCIICHDSTNMDGNLTLDDLSGLQYNGAAWDKADTKTFCFACHNASGTDAQGQHIQGADIAAVYPNDYHGDKPYYKDIEYLRPDNKLSDSINCLSCHRQHESANRTLFIESGAETGIVNDSAANSATIVLNNTNPSDFRDLCAICHTSDPAAHPASVQAPNGLYQTTKHTDSVCFTCHRENSMRPPSKYPVGVSVATTMMTVGENCTACHKHGANMGPQNTKYPDGTSHSVF